MKNLIVTAVILAVGFLQYFHKINKKQNEKGK